MLLESTPAVYRPRLLRILATMQQKNTMGWLTYWSYAVNLIDVSTIDAITAYDYAAFVAESSLDWPAYGAHQLVMNIVHSCSIHNRVYVNWNLSDEDIASAIVYECCSILNSRVQSICDHYNDDALFYQKITPYIAELTYKNIHDCNIALQHCCWVHNLPMKSYDMAYIGYVYPSLENWQRALQ